MAIHSLPTQPPAEPYEMITRLSPPHLRPYVLGWAGFRTPAGEHARPSRMLPLNAATLIIDFTGLGPIVTGPRATVTFSAHTPWRHGVAVGLTPAGMSALTGAPIREVAGTTAHLEDLLGSRAAELADRLIAPAGWADRFRLLEGRLTAWLRPDAGPDGLIMRAWWRLQEPAGPPTIASLAGELGVSRRYVELGFRRVVGLSPKTVARIARFQRTVDLWRRPSAMLTEAVACGYADQPHLTREIRAMTRMTPKELFAFVQDTDRLTG
ncbi:helix-turn-helix transcriptional regulator [Nonomuraea jiangxiensis]|uniref:AraC-type DNA-binding protein n=1 Tax=Nonomuraea jiangxiensis TaxID=633440 RepID=A0A1G9TIH2_9ACTN|nr:AraC family transcriptional regulator [Nonomuraea jiangxiensis]SDM47589.1 AraC-type DNA-binding protein [Nonomuraea jiangxiensis]